VLSSAEQRIESKDVVTVNAIVQSQSEEMGSVKPNVIMRDISDRKPIRHQKFLDGKMRKLNDP
jgi:hypothetical protein